MEKLSNLSHSKFSLGVVAASLLGFLGYWAWRFNAFTPHYGTSTAAISALWGEFLVGLLIMVVTCGVILAIDNRRDKLKLYQLAAFWLVVATVATTVGLFANHQIQVNRARAEQAKIAAEQARLASLPRPTPAPIPAPKPKSYVTVATLSGSSNQRSDSFELHGGKLRVSYTVSGGNTIGLGIVTVDISLKSESLSGYLDTINVGSPGSTTSYFRPTTCSSIPSIYDQGCNAGNYYLDIGDFSHSSWSVKLEEEQ